MLRRCSPSPIARLAEHSRERDTEKKRLLAPGFALVSTPAHGSRIKTSPDNAHATRLRIAVKHLVTSLCWGPTHGLQFEFVVRQQKPCQHNYFAR